MSIFGLSSKNDMKLQRCVCSYLLTGCIVHILQISWHANAAAWVSVGVECGWSSTQPGSSPANPCVSQRTEFPLLQLLAGNSWATFPGLSGRMGSCIPQITQITIELILIANFCYITYPVHFFFLCVFLDSCYALFHPAKRLGCMSSIFIA